MCAGIKCKLSDIKNAITHHRNYSIENIACSYACPNKLGILNSQESGHGINERLNLKLSSQMAALVLTIANLTCPVVDLGLGKGYSPTLLATYKSLHTLIYKCTKTH